MTRSMAPNETNVFLPNSNSEMDISASSLRSLLESQIDEHKLNALKYLIVYGCSSKIDDNLQALLDTEDMFKILEQAIISCSDSLQSQMTDAIVSQDIPRQLPLAPFQHQIPTKPNPFLIFLVCLLEAGKSNWNRMKTIASWLHINGKKGINFQTFPLLATRFLNIIDESMLLIESHLARIEGSSVSRVFMTIGEYDDLAHTVLTALLTFDRVFGSLRIGRDDGATLLQTKHQLVKRGLSLVTTAPSFSAELLPKLSLQCREYCAVDEPFGKNGFRIPFRLDDSGEPVETCWADIVVTILNETHPAIQPLLCEGDDLNSADLAVPLRHVTHYLQFVIRSWGIVEMADINGEFNPGEKLDSALDGTIRAIAPLLPVLIGHLQTCPLRQSDPSSHSVSLPPPSQMCPNHDILVECLSKALQFLKTTIVYKSKYVLTTMAHQFGPTVPPTIAGIVSMLIPAVCPNIPGTDDCVRAALDVLSWIAKTSPEVQIPMIRTNMVATVLQHFQTSALAYQNHTSEFLSGTVHYLLQLGTDHGRFQTDANEVAAIQQDVKQLVFVPVVQFVHSIRPLISQLDGLSRLPLIPVLLHLLSRVSESIPQLPGLWTAIQPAKLAFTFLSLMEMSTSRDMNKMIFIQMQNTLNTFRQTTPEGKEDWISFSGELEDEDQQVLFRYNNTDCKCLKLNLDELKCTRDRKTMNRLS
ncbi:hypothetical protein BLNAU_12968 [Blattamonas nauphoetae]|uniref:Uncharacterized protein n=1 Tax=Blattamonas nauphoetae TaxID=2049346 RepID=A0ABQ9XI60_9EUKA|nr:hypothetical protein BLNAU_12968 [Blattamonas nauphoetae]